MDDISGTFYILLFGYTASGLNFFMEIFYHDFLQFLDLKKLFRRIKSRAWRRKQAIFAKRIQVRPT